MHAKWMRWYGILAVVLLIAPMVVVAQEPSREPRRGNARGWPRGEIHVTNDWHDDVKVTMWSGRRERIGEWILQPGASALLEVDGESIKVRPGYKIKVGDDWGWVNVGEVGQFHDGIWSVSVRDIWQATHRKCPGVPDWKG